jgi:hypothetical protein
VQPNDIMLAARREWVWWTHCLTGLAYGLMMDDWYRLRGTEESNALHDSYCHCSNSHLSWLYTDIIICQHWVSWRAKWLLQ